MKSLSNERKLFLSFLLLLVVLPGITKANQQARAPEIKKVEPPNWWTGSSINPVRLLVRGSNLHGARLSATRAGVRPEGVVVNPAGTYLFVSLNITPTARPGNYPLTIETENGKSVIPFRLDEPLDPAINFQGINEDDIIYLIMPDRFANGDRSNDVPAGAPPAATDRQNPRSYHGGDFRGIIDRLDYIKELGATAIWLNPWYDNWNGVSTCDHPWCPNTYYHGYHAIDYYGVEDHFGDLATLRELVRKAHAIGLKVIQDQVANHIGSRHPWASDPPLDNWFHGTLAAHARNEFRGDLLLSPHAGAAERRPTLDGWFSDDMPDMNQEEPEVARYEIQNALWWIGVTGIDGIRQDTIQYMPRRFIRELSCALHKEYPRMWMVGEVFDRDPVHTAFFIGGHTGWDRIDTHLDSVFDFPLWQTSLDVFTGKKPARALRDMLKYDALYPDPSRLVTMAGNHDVRRFLSLDGGTLEGAMLHLAFTLTVRGTPQIYYGDEIAMAGGDDPDNRRDFPGGFPSDARNAFEAGGRASDEQRMYEWTRDWIRFRREHRAIRRGQLIDLAYGDDACVYARQDADETIIIAVNRAAQSKSLTASARSIAAAEGAELLPLMIASDHVKITDGAIRLTVPAKSVVAYKVVSP